MIVFFPQPTIDLKCLNGSLNQTLLCILCDSDCILLPSKPIGSLEQRKIKLVSLKQAHPIILQKNTSYGLFPRYAR